MLALGDGSLRVRGDSERVIAVNFLSCLWTSFAAIPAMLEQETTAS